MSSRNYVSPISLVFLNSFSILSVTPSSKSLMYTKHKIGPSTEPCHTPLNTSNLRNQESGTLYLAHCPYKLIHAQMDIKSDGRLPL